MLDFIRYRFRQLLCRCGYVPCGRNGGLYKNRWVPVTYRGDKSTFKYHDHKKFPEIK